MIKNIQNLTHKFTALPQWQRWMLLFVVVILPAGILLGTILFKVLAGTRKTR